MVKVMTTHPMGMGEVMSTHPVGMGKVMRDPISSPPLPRCCLMGTLGITPANTG